MDKISYDKGYAQALKDERERIIAEFDKTLKLALQDDAYFRILTNNVLEYIRTGLRAAERQRTRNDTS